MYIRLQATGISPRPGKTRNKTVIKSMTGYGRAVETVNGREFTVELRSVNNRYLDCSVRLPRILSFGEDAVKQAVKNSISRGKVDVFISVHSEAGDEVQVTLNKNVHKPRSSTTNFNLIRSCVFLGKIHIHSFQLTEALLIPGNPHGATCY